MPLIVGRSFGAYRGQWLSSIAERQAFGASVDVSKQLGKPECSVCIEMLLMGVLPGSSVLSVSDSSSVSRGICVA